MPPTRSSRPSLTARAQRTLVDSLDAVEAKQLLATLLDAHPELGTEAAALAGAQLGAVSEESVVEEVTFALEMLDVEDIWARSGELPGGGGYVEPIEAAWEVVEEGMEPFLVDLARRVELGRRTEATAVGRGMLLGLYRAAQADEEFLGGYAPDVLGEVATRVISAWKKRSKGHPGKAIPIDEWAVMRQFVSDAVPEWQPFLTRTLGRRPAQRRRR